ncbi:complement factor H-like [Pagrus major]|uniref:complement factor H-like n=1 Tax=Pagrus major TaxID=143350 RepID=UPI003CC86603
MHVITQSCVLLLWMCALTTVKSQDCTRQQFLGSKLYDANFDTTNLEESYPGGKQIRVGCKVGYAGFFKIICVEGDWISRGTKCQPRSCGHPGDAQFADFQLEEGDDFVFGSKVVYTCHKGYQMVSRITYRRCMAAGWDGVVPVCEAQQCPVIHVNDNVQVNGDPEEATYGNVVRFSCKSNTEILLGPTEIYCDETGLWSGEAPQCKEIKCNAPEIENGIVHGNIREYNEHEVLHFECKPKYKRTEDRPSKCIKIGIRAEWSPTPVCELAKCRLTLPPLEGTSYEPAYRNVFTPDEQVTVTCGEKYWISNPRDTSAVTTCTATGDWTVRPVCKEVTCRNQREQNVYSWDVYWGQRITLGDTARYRCRSGYKSTDGTNLATCTRDEWRPKPLCQEIICETEDIPNANIVNPKWRYRNNERANYECKEGYEGRPTRICGANGWTGDSQCTEITCRRQDFETAEIHGNIQPEYSYNEQVEYVCKSGYTGRFTLTCGQRDWIGQEQCREIICKRENIPNANIVNPKWRYRNNEQANYECKEGYEGHPTRICGENGWTGDSQCTEVLCNKPDIQDADIIHNNKESYSHEEQVQFECKNNVRKRFTVTCKRGNWIDVQSCAEVLCNKLDIRDADIIHNKKERYSHEEQVQFECKNDVEKQFTVICKHGNWTEVQSCAEVLCNKLDIRDADIIHNKKERYSHEEQVQFECKNDVEKQFTVICKHGNWTEVQSCAECPKPDVPNGFVIVSKDNYMLSYTCNTDYKLFTNGWWGEATCLGSKWSGLESIQCIEKTKCGEIPAIPNAEMKPQHTAYESNKSVPIICKPGYQAQVEHLNCQEGDWTSNGASLETICTPSSNSCSHPPEFKNAVVVGTLYQKIFLSGSVVSYQCRAEYTTAEGETETLRCNNGQWENKSITCEPSGSHGRGMEKLHAAPEQQADPERPADPELHAAPEQLPNPESEPQFVTAQPLVEMRSSLILIFLQLWGNVQVSVSQNVTCSELPDVPHAYLSEETERAEYQEGHVIHFTCEMGYISGPTIRYVCTSGGWVAIHKGQCYLRPCELPDDTPNGYYQLIHGGEFVFGSIIRYFCNEGYQMVSRVDTRTCMLNKWSNHVPICEALSCEPPPAVERIQINGLPDNEGPILPDRFLTFSCDDPGTYLNGSSMLICGKDGKWDRPFPSCEDVTCQVPGMHSHLSVVGLSPANKTVRSGHTIRFQCKSPHTLDGSEAIECLQSGEWSAPFPTCAEKCQVTGVPNSVHITPSVPNKQLRRGQQLRFTCRYHGHFLQGKAMVECLADGQWSAPFPTCGGPLGCNNPPSLTDGDTRESLRGRYSHNERVEYVCQNLYQMEGEPYQTCRNGEWLGRMRCLRPCTVDTEAMSRHNIAFKYKDDNKLYAPHNDHITFTCVRGRHDGRLNMRQSCIDGVMHLPTCH